MAGHICPASLWLILPVASASGLSVPSASNLATFNGDASSVSNMYAAVISPGSAGERSAFNLAAFDKHAFGLGLALGS